MLIAQIERSTYLHFVFPFFELPREHRYRGLNNNNNNNNNNNELRYLCVTEMKTDRTQRNEQIMVSRLTDGAALWRMQLTFPYNTQLGAVPYRMIMKQ